MSLELDKAKADLLSAETLQEAMKVANAIIRSGKNVSDRLVSEAKLTKEQAAKIMQKDFAGRTGFPTYQLTNNNAYIKRLKDKVTLLDQKTEAAAGEEERYNFEGGSVLVNYEDDRVQIFHDEKPNPDQITALKKSGWKWSPKNKAWQRKATPQAISSAKYITKATGSAPVREQKGPINHDELLESRKFSYVGISIYGGVPKEYTGDRSFHLVYFDVVAANVKEAVKAYFKEHLPEIPSDEVKINVYPKTYVRESKALIAKDKYLPTDAPAKVVLSPGYQQIKDFFATQKEVKEKEPEPVIVPDPEPAKKEIGPENKVVRDKYFIADFGGAFREVAKVEDLEIGNHKYFVFKDGKQFGVAHDLTGQRPGGIFDDKETAIESAKQAIEKHKEQLESVLANKALSPRYSLDSLPFDDAQTAKIRKYIENKEFKQVYDLIYNRDNKVSRKAYSEVSGFPIKSNTTIKEIEQSLLDIYGFDINAKIQQEKQNKDEAKKQADAEYWDSVKLKYPFLDLEGLTPLEMGRIQTYLDKQWNFDKGGVMSMGQFLKNNQSDFVAKKEHLKKYGSKGELAKPVTEYRLLDKEGFIRDVPKIIFDRFVILEESIKAAQESWPGKRDHAIKEALSLDMNSYTPDLLKESEYTLTDSEYFKGASPTATDFNNRAFHIRVADHYGKEIPDAVKSEYIGLFPIQIEDPNTGDEFDNAIMENITPHDGWLGHVIKEREVKQQIYKQLSGPEHEKPATVERIFAKYKSIEREKNKSTPPPTPIPSSGPVKTNRSQFMDDLETLDLWQHFDGDNRFYRKFEFSKDKLSEARSILDLGIKESLIDRTDGGLNAIISVPNEETADWVSEKYMEWFPVPKPEPKEEPGLFDDLSEMKHLDDVEKNVDTIAEGYADRPMAALQVMSYLTKHANPYVNSFMRKHKLDTKEKLVEYVGKRQTILRAGKGKERSEFLKSEKKKTAEFHVNNIFNMAAEQSAAMDEKIAALDNELPSDMNLLKRYPKLSKNEVVTVYNRVEEILSQESFTDQDKYILEQYEGLGSQTQTGIVDKGLLHQFYTPYILGKKMYELAYKYGAPKTNAVIVEPSMGTGRFFKFAPKGSTCIGFDPDKKNVEIAKILYPDATIYQQEFETAFLEAPRYNRMAKKSWLPEADLCIGNPPYGDYMGYYKSYMPSIFKRFEFLFVYLGLKTLKKDGLLIFIVSQNFMNNGAMYNGMKAKILELGTFVDAIRMPNGIFSSTEVGTDIIIFRKK